MLLLKSLALVAVLMGSGVMAADTISMQDQIYVISGVLGGVCLLLTIAIVFITISLIKLQKHVAVLKAGAKTMLEPAPRPAPPPRPYRGPPPRDSYY